MSLSDAMPGVPVLRTVLVVDDHRTVAELLALALRGNPLLSRVESALSAEEALTRLASTPADVVVMDYRLGDADGVATTRQIRQRWPGTVVVMLTAYPTRALMADAAAAGASALLPKDGALSDLIEVLWTATPDRFTVPPALLRVLVDQESKPHVSPLTGREHDVLGALAQGHDIGAVSRLLGISVHTGRSHVKSILAKLEAHTQLEAVAVAHRHGLLEMREH